MDSCKHFIARQHIRIHPVWATKGPAHAGSPLQAPRPRQPPRRTCAGPSPCLPQHSFLKALLRLPSPPGISGQVQFVSPPPRPGADPTPTAARHSSSRASFTFVLRTDLVEFPLLLSHLRICPFVYCMCLLDGVDADKRNIPKKKSTRVRNPLSIRYSLLKLSPSFLSLSRTQ